MLLDEPFAGLDQIRRVQVSYYLKSNGRWRPSTPLCAAHDFAPIVPHFNHVFEIMNGIIVKHL